MDNVIQLTPKSSKNMARELNLFWKQSRKLSRLLDYYEDTKKVTKEFLEEPTLNEEYRKVLNKFLDYLEEVIRICHEKGEPIHNKTKKIESKLMSLGYWDRKDNTREIKSNGDNK